MRSNQQTIKKSYTFSGKGLHSGLNTTIKLLPAPVNHGIKFCRVDLPSSKPVEALASNVVATERGTVLKSGEASISTVEHLLSALWGLGVDNLLVEVDGVEIPILDGSSTPFIEKIGEEGVVKQEAKKDYIVVKEPIEVSDPTTGSSIRVEPSEEFSIELTVDFNSSVVGVQKASFDQNSNYREEIAPNRTFVFLHHLLPLINNNLIKGGDLENALVIVEERIEGEQLRRLEEVFGLSQRESLERGYLNGDKLKFNNECARHKLLDLIGDLSLAGRAIKGRVIAERPGHKINVEIAKKIMKMVEEKRDGIPKFDPNAEPVVDINGIKELLPHRPPFLMVDRIIEMGSDHVVGIKNIGINEGYFVGHFPQEPVMPGVLIIEAMAQVGGILVLSDLDEPERYSTYFVKIDNAKFKRKVVPGDQLVIELSISIPLRRSLVGMKGKVYVGDTLACEADLMAQVIKNK